MSILRNPTQGNFTIIANALITDSRISHAAFRVACYLMSRPDNWEINNRDIQKQLGIGKPHTLAGYWKELIDAGIIFRRQKTGVGGRYNGFDYAIFQEPEDWKNSADLPYAHQRHTDEGHAVNGHTSNNTDLNNTEHNKKEGNANAGNIAGRDARNQPAKKQRRLYADEIPEQYSTTKLAMHELNSIIKSKRGHNFALDKQRHELTVSPNDLQEIECNLSELEIAADVSLIDALINVYNERGRLLDQPVNLAFLAGIGMNLEHISYAEWASQL